MKRWWLVGALLLSLGINLGLVAQGLMARRGAPPPPTSEEPPRPSPGPGAPDLGDRPSGEVPRVLERMADDLELDGEVREQFLEVHHRFLARTLRGRRHLGEIQSALRQQILAQEPDRQAIDRLLQQSARTHYELEKTFVETLLAGRAMLDSEQEDRYTLMLKRWRRSREARRTLERWRGPGALGDGPPGELRGPRFRPGAPGDAPRARPPSLAPADPGAMPDDPDGNTGNDSDPGNDTDTGNPSPGVE